jgi:hypothetical protein
MLRTLEVPMREANARGRPAEGRPRVTVVEKRRQRPRPAKVPSLRIMAYQ